MTVGRWRHRVGAIVLMVLSTLLISCASPPQRPALDLSRLPTEASLSSLSVRSDTDGPGRTIDWPTQRWWTSWKLPALEARIDRALRQAPTLSVAQARVRGAQAVLDRSLSGQGAQAGLAIDSSLTRYSEFATAPPALAGRHAWSHAARVALNWDLDWSGRQRASVESSFAALQAVQADAQAAQVLLSTEVALVWFEWARLTALIHWSERMLAVQDQQLALLEQRVRAGLERRDTLELLVTERARTQSDYQGWIGSQSRTQRALAELCGDGPDQSEPDLPQWPQAGPPAPAADLPVSLLGRRADLVALRWRIESAQGGVLEAHAAHYPDVNLAAFAGLISLGLDRWLSLGARSYAVGPVISLPIFDAGARTARQNERESQRDVLIGEYHGALLRAFREVAQELDGLRSLQQQAQALEQASHAARSASHSAGLRQQAGLGSLQPVLESQRLDLQQQRPLLEIHARQWMARIGLVRALGGGFDDERSPYPVRSILKESK